MKSAPLSFPLALVFKVNLPLAAANQYMMKGALPPVFIRHHYLEMPEFVCLSEIG